MMLKLDRRLTLILLTILVILGFITLWFWRGAIFSKEILKLEILGPESVKMGEEVSYTVTYKIDAAAAQTIAWTGSLAAGATTTVNLPGQTFTAGNHTITATSSMPNGQTDLFAGNDNTVTNFAVFANPSGTPVAEGFQLAAYPPAGWTLVNLDGGTTTWKRATTVGGYQTTTKSTWYDFYNNAADGDHDHLFLPYADLSMITSPINLCTRSVYTYSLVSILSR